MKAGLGGLHASALLFASVHFEETPVTAEGIARNILAPQRKRLRAA
jgi:hypothetical protein